MGMMKCNSRGRGSETPLPSQNMFNKLEFRLPPKEMKYRPPILYLCGNISSTTTSPKNMSHAFCIREGHIFNPCHTHKQCSTFTLISINRWLLLLELVSIYNYCCFSKCFISYEKCGFSNDTKRSI